MTPPLRSPSTSLPIEHTHSSTHDDHNLINDHQQNEKITITKEEGLSIHSIHDSYASISSQVFQEPHHSSKNNDDLYAGQDLDLEAARTTTTASSIAAPPYSVFSQRKKKFIIVMAVWAGFFSPLSANIYFPALNILAKDLNVSSALINLTLTSYMIFQGLAPTIFGDLADIAGRRPAYIIGFIIYLGACIGIALQDSFAALIILRCLQSSGSSGTIALSSGVVADISTSAERGVYMGWVTSGILLGPAIGPILGGILSQFLGWRSIFWFLVIMVGVFLIPFIITFPETARNVVGNGSIPPQGWNMSLLNYLAVRKQAKLDAAGTSKDSLSLARSRSRESARAARNALQAKRKLKFPNPLHTLAVVKEKDMGLLLFYNSIVYTAFYDVTASTPYLFAQTYGFNDLQIGLSFIPFGIGCFMAPLVNGRLLDWNFRRVAASEGLKVTKKHMVDLKTFPLERARVHCAWPILLIGDAALLAYGWAMEANAPLAVALVLQFIIGLCLTGSFGVMSVMLVDNYPLSPATATAGNNLVRCLIGAGGTAVIIYMIDAMGRGWCFTFIAAVVAALTPIMWVLLKWGPGWRMQRQEVVERLARKKEELERREVEMEREEEDEIEVREEVEKPTCAHFPVQGSDVNERRA